MPKGIFKRTKQTIKNMVNSSHKGDKNRAWKGEKAKYSAIHQWVRKWKGKLNYCELCGNANAKRYEWANIDHKYRRILEDYIRMCVSCHIEYDKKLRNK
jgi:hypothetical protein